MSVPGEGLSLPIRGTIVAAQVGVRIFGRVTVEGEVDAAARSGPLLVVANHVSNSDAVLVAGWVQPRLGRRVHWLGKREMVEWPLLGRLVRAVEVHPVDRGAGDIDAFRTALRVLEDGHALVVFPEGTRSASGVLGEGHDGVTSLAMRANAHILPVGVAGTRRLWPKGGKPRFGAQVTVRIGRSFLLADELPPDLDRRAAKSAGTEVVMRRIADLLPPEQRGRYGEPSA
jgi:1-acyl-sn-glycerol-3-phosphate acyltransferase